MRVDASIFTNGYLLLPSARDRLVDLAKRRIRRPNRIGPMPAEIMRGVLELIFRLAKLIGGGAHMWILRRRSRVGRPRHSNGADRHQQHPGSKSQNLFLHEHPPKGHLLRIDYSKNQDRSAASNAGSPARFFPMQKIVAAPSTASANPHTPLHPHTFHAPAPNDDPVAPPMK